MDPSTTYSGSSADAAGLLGGGVLLFVCLFYVAIIAVMVLIYWKIFSKAGYSGWLSLLMFVPIVNIVMMFFLAFADWPVLRENRDLKAKANAPVWPAAGTAAAPSAPAPAPAAPVAPPVAPSAPASGGWPETSTAPPPAPSAPAAPEPPVAPPVAPSAPEAPAPVAAPAPAPAPEPAPAPAPAAPADPEPPAAPPVAPSVPEEGNPPAPPAPPTL